MNPSQHHPRSNLRFALRVLWLLTKGLFLMFVLLVLLIVASLAAFPQLFDSERVRQVIVTELSEILHRPVQIQGVVMSPQGIKLRGVHVFSHMEPGKALLESDIAVVTVKLKPLLERKLELNNVRLVAPRIKLWRDEEGAWNIDDLLPSTAAVRSASVGRFTLPVSLAAEHTVIEDGTLEVDDRLKKTSTKIVHFGLSVRRFDFDKPFSLTMSFDNVSRFADKELHASVSLDGSVSLASQNWAEAYVRAERLEAKIDGRPIRGSAGLSDFLQPALTADLLLPALGPADWQNYLGKNYDLALPPSRVHLKAQVLAPKQYKVEQLRVTAGPATLSAAGSLDLSGPKPRLEVFATVPDMPLDALAAYKPSMAHLRLKGTASAEAGASGWTDKLIVHRAKVHLRGFSAALKHSTIERGDIDASAANDFSNFSASIGRGAVSAFGESFTDISGTIGLVGQDLAIDNASVRWGESRLKLKARVQNLSKPKEVALSGDVDKVSWERVQQLVTTIVASVSTNTVTQAEAHRPWVQTFKYAIPRRFPDTIGYIHVGEVSHKNFRFANTEAVWDLHGVTPSLKGVNGDMRVGFGPGRVNDIQAVQESNKFLRIIFLPYIYMYKLARASQFNLQNTVPKELDFERIEGQYSVVNGVVTTHFTHVNSAATVLLADGTADFGRERVNMTVMTRLGKAPKAALPDWWVDMAGRPSIGFRVTGDLGNPDLEVRLKKFTANEIDDRLGQDLARAVKRFAEIEKLKILIEPPAISTTTPGGTK